MDAWHRLTCDVAVDFGGPVARPTDALSDEERAMPLFALVEKRAAADPERIALVTADGSLTYREVVATTLGLAGRILEAQQGAGDPVCVLAPQGMLHLLSGLACLRLGMAYVPLDPDHSRVRNLQVAARAGAKVLVCREIDRDAAAAFAPRARLVTDSGAGAAYLSHPYPGPDAITSIFFTSGTTGVPKGVARSARSLMSTIDNRIRGMHHNRSDRFAYIGGPSVAGPLQLCMGVLALGARYSLIAATAPLDAIVAMLRREEATMLHCGIGMLRLIAQHPGAREALARVAGVRTVGDIVEWKDIAALYAVLPDDAHIYCNYAATESSQIAGWFVPRDIPPEGGRVPLGYPARNSELWLDRGIAGRGDEGVIGEMVTASPRLAQGYWNDPDASAVAFLPHPQDDRRRIYRTGDLVRSDPSGLLHFLGRVDNQVKLHGWRIEIEEIEAVALGVEGVSLAGVAPRRDDQGKVVALALHVAADEALRADAEPLARRLRDALPRHMWPAQIVVSASLPSTASGKVDRLRLREIDAQLCEARTRQTAATDSPWADPLARRIADALAREARVARCSPDDRFTDIGGDSLKALQAALSIEKVFGVTIDPADLLGGTRLGAIVAAIVAECHALRQA